jgi:hypothetical protein
LKRFALAFLTAALVAVVPAQAKKPIHRSHPAHPSHTNKGHHRGTCKVRKVGYNASGTLVSATLTPAAGEGRYDGTITVDVTRANHKAPKGTQTFTLTDARVRFGKGVDQTAPAAGSRVRLHGKITALPHHCDSAGFTPTITIRNVRIGAPHKKS